MKEIIFRYKDLIKFGFFTIDFKSLEKVVKTQLDNLKKGGHVIDLLKHIPPKNEIFKSVKRDLIKKEFSKINCYDIVIIEMDYDYDDVISPLIQHYTFRVSNVLREILSD